IEAFRQTARLPTRRRDHPDAFMSAGLLPDRGQERDQVAAGRPGRCRHLQALCGQAPRYPRYVRDVQPRGPAKVRVGLCVADDGDRAPVGRPGEAADRPRTLGELAWLPTLGFDHEQVSMPAVEIADPVTLVAQRPHDPCDRWPAALLLAVGWA